MLGSSKFCSVMGALKSMRCRRPVSKIQVLDYKIKYPAASIEIRFACYVLQNFILALGQCHGPTEAGMGFVRTAKAGNAHRSTLR